MHRSSRMHVGIEPGTSISFDLAPVFSALRFNQYFESVCLSDITAANAMQLLAGCMKNNCTISRLVLSNLQSMSIACHTLTISSNPNQQLSLSFFLSFFVTDSLWIID
jgi:hypothetical protein